MLLLFAESLRKLIANHVYCIRPDGLLSSQHLPGTGLSRCSTLFRCTKERLGFETAATIAQRPPLYVCNPCLEIHVPSSLRPAELSPAHGHLDHLFYSSGIICHRHPDQANQLNNFSAVERACQAYHDLFGDMYDPEADVSRWNLEREAFQTRYFTELKRRYKLDFSHDMPARMEEASRKLLESCFGGFFLRPDTLGWI
jgi:hypothetical protein